MTWMFADGQTDLQAICSPGVRWTNSTTPFFPPDPENRMDLNLKSPHTLPRAAGHTCSVTASSAAVWSVFMSSARHLEISLSLVLTVLQSDVHFVLLRFDWRLSHFTRSRVFGRVALSAAAALTLLPFLLHSPLPPLLSSAAGKVIFLSHVTVIRWPSHLRPWTVFHETKCHFSF